jgi:glyoxylase I family protein
MFHGLYHINIVVRDLDRTLDFYCGVLGFTVAFDKILTDDQNLGRGLGVKGDCRMRWAMIRLGTDENAPVLDVEQWIEPAITGTAYPACSNVGIGRIALKVTGIEQVYDDLVTKGVKFLSPPQTLNIPGFDAFKFCCFKDPDDITLELVEA